MDLPTPSTPPSAEHGEDASTPPAPRRGRGGTRLRDLTVSRSSEQRIPIEIDMQTGKASGPNKDKFVSYVALIARSKVSILIDKWKEVEESVKNQIWQSILVIIITLLYVQYICIYIHFVY